ncbi:sugar O-acyltransferase, sialic acid O-acetyltransferase NeuD family [Thermoanaerobacter siderophilus SR4]|uniref:Sugar O-acyltransferase, sialic acid O-acetyltransferase NeuD family n=1 Tax=Thermoanaerobacter siderophilus SR4 TaxID=880478 RepID=I9KUL8_9THEO|nr:acetyltransferase [Thermoanaerobacter siderophilus]EIW00674.1 sugar O-acyltransferase, sialic acid O-acetyltransferase NeuD family [Thermoanaerobacter siderophilus SR4]
MNNIKDIVIIGAGGFAREVAWLIEDINKEKQKWNLLGFIDENIHNKGKILNNYPVLGGFEVIEKFNDLYVVCAVGDPKIKRNLITKALRYNVKFATLIHPTVIMSQYLTIGEGSIICAGNIITTNIKIGSHVIVNLDCTIGHDVVISDYATILPSVNISGNVSIGEGCSIGTGSAIIQGKKIGEWSIIGAGAVVVDDIPPYCTAVGVPAKPIKFHEEDE